MTTATCPPGRRARKRPPVIAAPPPEPRRKRPRRREAEPARAARVPAGPPTGELGLLCEDHPLRPPDWRYRLAMALLDARRQPPPDDPDLAATHRLVNWLRRLDAADRRVPADLVPYHRALKLYLGP